MRLLILKLAVVTVIATSGVTLGFMNHLPVPSEDWDICSVVTNIRANYLARIPSLTECENEAEYYLRVYERI